MFLSCISANYLQLLVFKQGRGSPACPLPLVVPRRRCAIAPTSRSALAAACAVLALRSAAVWEGAWGKNAPVATCPGSTGRSQTSTLGAVSDLALVGKVQAEWVCQTSFQSVERRGLVGLVGLKEKLTDIGFSLQGLELSLEQSSSAHIREGCISERQERGGFPGEVDEDLLSHAKFELAPFPALQGRG